MLSWDFTFFVIVYYIKKILGSRYYGIIVNMLGCNTLVMKKNIFTLKQHILKYLWGCY